MASKKEVNLKCCVFFLSIAVSGILCEDGSVQIVDKTPKLEYCTFFNNRKPTYQPDLKNCTWFSERSCCRQAEIAATFGKVKPLPGATEGCQQMINYLMCYICAPRQNHFYKRERLSVCESFCNLILEACGQAILKGETIGNLYDNGKDFCESRRFEVVSLDVAEKNCFDFDVQWDSQVETSADYPDKEVDVTMAFSKPAAVLAGTAAVAAGVHTVYPYWYRDIQETRSTKAREEIFKSCVQSKTLFVDLFEEVADKTPYKPFVIYNDTLYSYGDIEVMANKMAYFVEQHGLKINDTVAIMMYNEPAYIWTVLGLGKLGIKCALINYKLRSDSLLHCIGICDCKVLLVGEGNDLVQAVTDVSSSLIDKQMMIWSIGNKDCPETITKIDDELRMSKSNRPPRDGRRTITYSDPVVYIFTSGTTGATLVLSSKFSVRHFWEICCKHDATVILHVGELCRFLLSAPEKPEDRMNKVRCIIGNGLQADIWNKFVQRFGITTVVELYGGTDLQTFFCVNDEVAKVGAVGKFSPLLKKRAGFELVKCNYETVQPIRNSKGLCIPVKLGEPGLLLSLMPDITKYYGYQGNRQLSEQKLVRNILKKGDVYINSGDLLILDKDYYLYFFDRLGDTFRWRGENVSTSEVAQVMTSYVGVQEANVYGVKVPGHNGRAGMAAVVLEDGHQNFDFKKFYAYLHSKLPSYACPVFLRISEKLDMTGTLKYTKTGLVKEGFDPAIIDDVIFVMVTNIKTYAMLDDEKYKHIITGDARL
ncbi:long-chain fatty acid transport protein 2-like [Glandiceps talaboti]